jgi:hypothetical protein
LASGQQIETLLADLEQERGDPRTLGASLSQKLDSHGAARVLLANLFPQRDWATKPGLVELDRVSGPAATASPTATT